MQRITTNVEAGIYARLADLARHRDVPTAHLIREALERYVTEEEATVEPGPLPDWVGMLEGPGGAYASHDEEVLRSGWAKALEAERHER